MLALFRKKNPYEIAARTLYARLLESVRRPGFYAQLGVPDSFDGRFDLLMLHLFLIIRRLNGEGSSGKEFSQALFDACFADMDQTLREMGIGDMGVPKHMRRMMKGFNGRIQAYDGAFGDAGDFSAALRRNLYGTAPGTAPEAIAEMAEYARNLAVALERISLTDMAEGRMVLPEI